ncbi:hypothetical protein [Prosthecobacter sp.]|uniref:hypothetical protein n=1 Tax=Prosthecobacter sp. TaxID=1965333 RepID=UPI003783A099
MEPTVPSSAAASLGMSSIALMVLGLICLVCWIKVLIALFKNAGAGLGILGIFCNIFAFIWGWVKSGQHGLKGTMIVWTLAFVAFIGVWGFAAKSLIESPEFKKGWEDGQRQIREQQRMQQPN